MNSIGYRQTVDELKNRESEIDDQKKENLINKISLVSVQYAQRQRTRFRRYKKDSLEKPKQNVYYHTIALQMLF